LSALISVIVPVYNVEKYITECLDSLRTQDFTDFEVIIVNDGTRDRSADIARDYIKDHSLSSFHVYDKPNGGISSARNHGMKYAAGEWLLFLDSDDWLEPNALSALAAAATPPTDIVYGGYQAYEQQTGLTDVWAKFDAVHGSMPEELSGLHSFSFCWGRLYRKSIIEKYSLQFDEKNRYCEDVSWQFDYNSHISAYSSTDAIILNYRINRPGALTSMNVTPDMKYPLWEHMCGFVDSIDPEALDRAVAGNLGLNRAMWNSLSTAVINDILDGKNAVARSKMKLALSRRIVDTYIPRSRKDKIFLLLWKGPFLLMRGFVNVYYRYFHIIRNSRIIRYISK